MAEHRDAGDWALFGALTLLWSSAYAFTRLAVETLPPSLIIPLRLTLGAVVILGVMVAMGERLPPLKEWRKWRAMALMGFVGMTAPFFVITTAQQTIDSSLAALYVAATPIFTVVAAHFAFHDERLTARKSLGIGVGFLGVATLFGPSVVAQFGSASMAAQGLCLLGTMFYAASTIIARSAPPMPSLVFAAGFVMFGALLSWPLALGVDYGALQPSTRSIIGVIALGIGSSALASIAYISLVQRAGATFLSLTGYAIPAASAIIGFLAFNERPSWLALAGFALVLAGVWLAQRPVPLPRPGTAPRSP